MGLVQGVLGNASKKGNDEFLSEWSSLISLSENVYASYKLVRDWIVITDKRLIYINVQGVTGTKKSIKSIPWHQIVAFEIISAGIADLNAELRLWVASSPFCVEVKFSSSVNIYEVQSIISDVISSFGGNNVAINMNNTEPKKVKKQTLDDIDI